MNPLYLVTSCHRSGSSMMMQCLKEGGLNPIYDISAESLNNVIRDYKPNPEGFYQFTGQVDKDFYNQFAGNLIKINFRDILKLPVGNYKIVFLKRKPANIRKSMLEWTPYEDWGPNMTLTFFYDKFFNAFFKEVKKRKDIDLIVLNYEDIVSNPQKEFKKLLGKKWKIDIAKCISKVKPELHRNQ